MAETLGDDVEVTAIPESWCDGAKTYWENQSATVNGMLGGFEHLADQDVKGSKIFLNKLKNELPGSSLVLDVGAGIGRVSRDLLLHYFDKVSLLECTESFIEKARENIPAERIEKYSLLQCKSTELQKKIMESMILSGYNGLLFMHLTSLVSFLQECSKLLKKGGKICIKDNVILPKPTIRRRFTSEEDDSHFDDILLDQEDCSITRSERYLLELTKLAGLEMHSRELQAKFPKEIFPVVTYSFNVKS